jgi:4-amino-4-deoxy-L-arabinose transferase-like glycosyltransferase
LVCGKKMKTIKNLLGRIDKYLFFVIILAAILRLSYLTFVPPSLNWDEVSHGYNAYSILTTGKDEWGVTLPTIFRAYGDYKLPAYIYLTAASEKLFGLTAFAVRLPSALAGIGTVVFTYLLTLELFKNKKIANISALLIAVEPWSLFLSRGAFEANLALFFIVVAVYCFLRSLRDSRPYFYLLPFTFLIGLSVWTYNSARIFVPILIITLILIYWKELLSSYRNNKRTFAFCLLPFAFLFLPMFIQLLQPIGQARYGKVSIVDSGATAKINEARNASKLPPILNRLVNNKVTYFGITFVKNWVSHYSADFLFLKGGSDYQFSVPGRGILYWIDILPIIVGLLWLVIKKSKANILIITWFLLSPIPSAITNEAPHVLRAIVMLPAPMIIAAIGLTKIADWLRKRFSVSQTLFFAIYAVVIFGFLENYLVSYFTSYRTDYSWSWQYGYQQIVDYAKEHYSDYDKIIVTKKYGEPHEFFLFFWPWNSTKYNTDPNLIRFFQSDWYWVDRFDKFYFVNDWQIPRDKGIFVLESKKETVDCTKGLKCLLVASPGNYPAGWNKLETVNFLNSDPAFELLDNLK